MPPASTFNPDDPRDVFVLAEALVRDCVLVATFTEDEVRPVIEASRERFDETERLFQELFARALRWSRTLTKLNNADDFQAAIAASRALFEMAVDLTLLHFARVDYPAEHMAIWEDSAKLKAARKIKRYYDMLGRPIPDEFNAPMDFLRKSGPAVEQLRRTHFIEKPAGSGKHPHPARWTQGSLESDAVKADEVSEAADLMPLKRQRIAMSYAEFYAARHDQLCWSVHGSALAGVRTLPDHHLPSLGANAMRECGDFIVRISELVLRELQMWTPAMVERFEALRDSRIRVFVEHVRHESPAFDARLKDLEASLRETGRRS